jgi:transposase
MNKTLPAITESADELKQLLRQAKGVRQQRVQALYLLASRQARNRSAVARLLGIHRNTVRAWLKLYAAGGLQALLTIGKAPGRTASLSPAHLAQLRTALSRPEGFGSYGEIRDWIEQELGVPMQYEAVRKLVRYRLHAKLKRARPTHIKKRAGRARLSGAVRARLAGTDGTKHASSQTVADG